MRCSGITPGGLEGFLVVLGTNPTGTKLIYNLFSSQTKTFPSYLPPSSTSQRPTWREGAQISLLFTTLLPPPRQWWIEGFNKGLQIWRASSPNLEHCHPPHLNPVYFAQ